MMNPAMLGVSDSPWSVMLPIPSIGPCTQCLFYAEFEGEDRGECRRRSPFQIDKEGDAVFPTVIPSDWCGDFAAKP
jgi:hypothetical protein